MSLDDRLLARIDKEARRCGLSRSAYLSQLTANELQLHTGPGRRASVGRALARLDDLFERGTPREEATTAIRSERDAR